MKITRTAIILTVIIVITLGLGIGQIVEEYQIDSHTGRAILDPEFNIEQIDQKVNPSAAALLETNEHELIEDASERIKIKDGASAIIEPTMIPGRDGDHYLYLDFKQKVVVISLYMKKQGNGEATFEIWGQNKKVAEGALSNEFKWYNFDVSYKDMSADKYALYNYGGGDAEIIIDQVYGVPKPRSGLSEHLTGLFYN